MASGVGELIDMLYNMVSDAWGVPLGAEKCIIDRDKVLDLLDEIKAQLPNELSEAKRLVTARTDYIANAKKEAETIRRAAEEHAKRQLDEQTMVKAAKARGNEIITQAEVKSAEIKRAVNDYIDDSLRRAEGSIAQALEELRQSRVKFKSASTQLPSQGGDL